ncbi:MAG TPA: DUF1501 domain-containing protein [Burkholderiaceae bacterium]|nr:DUF1501 domain-containing protein [Burkholderiaceae bacterium]
MNDRSHRNVASVNAVDHSRRAFLQTASSLSLLGAASPFAMNLAAIGAASAQSVTDYKALVCVFLFGGNDQTNTVIPFEAAEFAAYTNARPSIARAGADLTSLGAVAAQGGRSFALPNELTPLVNLWQSGKLAVLANVGPLFVPTTKSQFQNSAVPLPPKLFSHNDQQSVWQSTGAEGTTTGWGGRLADLILGGNTKQTFTAVSISGSAVFLSGQSVIQYQVGTGGPTAIGGLGGGLFGASAGGLALQQLITAARPTLFENEYNRVTSRSIVSTSDLNGALASAPALQTAFPTGNSLADQLKMVARMISVRQALGMARQVYFVSLGGFDTHDFQLRDQPTLHTTLADALSAFYAATVELGVANSVTTFTASDFGRTLISNGDGSDHGWGSHHFILGGSVLGGSIYGTFPQIQTGTPEDVGSGRLLPTTSVDQYAATLARWFGVADSVLPTVSPNIGNFTTRDMGFLA